MGNWTKPPFWISYTYKGKKPKILFEDRDGVRIKLLWYATLYIDPRGHLTSLRCAIIIVFDTIMCYGGKKPLAEFTELLAAKIGL